MTTTNRPINLERYFEHILSSKSKHLQHLLSRSVVIFFRVRTLHLPIHGSLHLSHQPFSAKFCHLFSLPKLFAKQVGIRFFRMFGRKANANGGAGSVIGTGTPSPATRRGSFNFSSGGGGAAAAASSESIGMASPYGGGTHTPGNRTVRSVFLLVVISDPCVLAIENKSQQHGRSVF